MIELNKYLSQPFLTWASLASVFCTSIARKSYSYFSLQWKRISFLTWKYISERNGAVLRKENNEATMENSSTELLNSTVGKAQLIIAENVVGFKDLWLLVKFTSPRRFHIHYNSKVTLQIILTNYTTKHGERNITWCDSGHVTMTWRGKESSHMCTRVQ